MPWSDEFRQLLILVSRGAHLDGQVAERAPTEILEGLVPLARSHGVAALAWRGAEASSGAVLSGVEAERLRSFAVVSVGDALRKFATVLTIDAALRDAGVRSIPFKGPVLSHILYGDPGLRRSVDLDLLVRGRDVAVAVRVLATLGFRWDRRESRSRIHRYLRDNCTMELTSTSGDLVDLNWAIVPRYYSAPLSVEGMFQRAGVSTLPGGTLLTPSSEDLYLALVLHAAKHSFERLAWIVDLTRLAKVRSDLDWQVLIDRASAIGIARLVHIAVLLGELVFGTPVPPQLAVEVARDDVARALAYEIVDRLDRVITVPHSEVEESLSRLQLRMRERPSDRARYLGRLALTPTVRDWDYIRLPDGLAGLYYLIRPVRLGSEAVSRLLRER